MDCDEIANEVSVMDSASSAESVIVTKAEKRCAKMSTSKSCLKQLEIEIKKQQKLVKEKRRNYHRKKVVNYSKTCLRQYNSYIQRIANCVDNVLPLVKKDLSLGCGFIICCVCFKPFARYYWQLHVISKHFYRRYKCLYCDHASALVDNLNRHMRSAHESLITIPKEPQYIENDSSEDDCDESFGEPELG